VLGIVGSSVKLSPESVTIPASSKVVQLPNGEKKTVTTPKQTLRSQARTFLDSGTSAAAGGLLRIVTSGIVEVASADAGSAAIKAGDALSLGANGKLSKKGASGATVGFALKGLGSGSGQIAILLLPR
jgi:hypothetical protein